MGSLVSILALSLRNGCLVLVEGDEVSNDKMREEFEMSAKEICLAITGKFVPARAMDGGYRNQTTQMLWDIWQASRESVVIELPKLSGSTYPDFDGGYDSAIEDIQKIIESAGLKVKP